MKSIFIFLAVSLGAYAGIQQFEGHWIGHIVEAVKPGKGKTVQGASIDVILTKNGDSVSGAFSRQFKTLESIHISENEFEFSDGNSVAKFKRFKDKKMFPKNFMNSPYAKRIDHNSHWYIFKSCALLGQPGKKCLKGRDAPPGVLKEMVILLNATENQYRFLALLVSGE